MPQSLFDQVKHFYAAKTIQGDTTTTHDLPAQRTSAEAEPDAPVGNQTNLTNLTSAGQSGSGLAASTDRNPTEIQLKSNPPGHPSADVAGERAAPAADVAGTRRPAASGTRLPANWREIDPRAYQPRPFGPLETDADWPGEQEDEDLPLPAAPDDLPGEPLVAPPSLVARPLGGSGPASAPPVGDPLSALEERCWLCEEEAECYDPSGQGWCSLCLEEAGKSLGWQELVDLLPAAGGGARRAIGSWRSTLPRTITGGPVQHRAALVAAAPSSDAEGGTSSRP
jgi:hypothetical protein